jgi:predicted CopG family antitoxin
VEKLDPTVDWADPVEVVEMYEEVLEEMVNLHENPSLPKKSFSELAENLLRKKRCPIGWVACLKRSLDYTGED